MRVLNINKGSTFYKWLNLHFDLSGSQDVCSITKKAILSLMFDLLVLFALTIVGSSILFKVSDEIQFSLVVLFYSFITGLVSVVSLVSSALLVAGTIVYLKDSYKEKRGNKETKSVIGNMIQSKIDKVCYHVKFTDGENK